MSAFTDEVVIERPCEEVFSFTTDPDHFKDMMPNVVEAQKVTEGEFGIGTKISETREIRGRKVTSTIEVIDFVPNERYSVRSALEGLETIYHYAFHSQGDSETKVTFECELKASTLKMKMIKPMFKKTLQKEDGDHLQLIKRALEDK
ncbi:MULTISPECIES: SRPBCC family protein [Pontibacillus]|uniref:SRPBCC family protein n=1 Tax=Pontibacillus chungwhensis TaxID=265426 RepID=A0ABY8UZC5_9BACI|nr:SRPBCC family protein [Pontibacillus chungwhensis]MCD5325491.1 SRPBCC family protein [Pontibacillus sp. HN14]WIF98603.1 SRPBCC family protein [Pontibacillus chungwhensis]